MFGGVYVYVTRMCVCVCVCACVCVSMYLCMCVCMYTCGCGAQGCFPCLPGPCVFCLVLNGGVMCYVGGLHNEFGIAPTAYSYVSMLYSSLQLYSAVVTLARRPHVQFAAIVQFAAYVQFAAIV